MAELVPTAKIFYVHARRTFYMSKCNRKGCSINTQKIVAIACGNYGNHDIKLRSPVSPTYFFDTMASGLLTINISGSPAVGAR